MPIERGNSSRSARVKPCGKRRPSRAQRGPFGNWCRVRNMLCPPSGASSAGRGAARRRRARLSECSRATCRRLVADYGRSARFARGAGVGQLRGVLGMGDLLLAVPADRAGARSIAPTDVAQFIRLDQCERFLRLRLHEHAVSRRFMEAFGVGPQSIPPLLTASGAAFEEQVEAAIARRYPVLDLARQATRPPDNTRVLAAVRELPRGGTLIVLQPRLE